MADVLYLRQNNSSSCRSKLDGVMRYARSRDWNVKVLNLGRCPRNLRTLVDGFGVGGCVIDACMEEQVPPLRWFAGCPTVLLDYNVTAPHGRLGAVSHDSEQTARLAAREILALGYEHAAFAAWSNPERSWVKVRREVFCREMRKAGVDCRVFDGAGDLSVPQRFQRALSVWVKALPKRCAVFAANDEVGEMLLTACRLSGIGVPGEVAVMGVDNDERICENARPQLASIQVDFERGGYVAAELLDEMMCRGGKTSERRMFGPLGVIRRASMRTFKRASARILKAVEHIRDHACEGLKARDVLEIIGGSRRLAELRFREATGHSILEEIHRARFEHLFVYLSQPGKKIDFAAAACGYRSVESLRRLFRQRTGLTMGEWRERRMKGR